MDNCYRHKHNDVGIVYKYKSDFRRMASLFISCNAQIVTVVGCYYKQCIVFILYSSLDLCYCKCDCSMQLTDRKRH